jgi:hypothetical protein
MTAAATMTGILETRETIAVTATATGTETVLVMTTGRSDPGRVTVAAQDPQT